ncbi:MAG: WD40-repeat-containing domain protein, partial [Olpidium bornovanus]
MALAVSAGASANSTAPGTPVQSTAAPAGMAPPAAGTSAHRQVPLTCERLPANHASAGVAFRFGLTLATVPGHGHTRPVVSVQFSAMGDDGNYFLVSACKDRTTRMNAGFPVEVVRALLAFHTDRWSVTSGTFQGHKGAVWSARLNSDASRAATGSADFTAKVWDAYTGEELLSLAHGHIVRATDLNRAGNLLATGGNEKILRVFDIGAMTEAPLASLTGHTGNIKNIAWDDARKVLLSAGDDGEIRQVFPRSSTQQGGERFWNATWACLTERTLLNFDLSTVRNAVQHAYLNRRQGSSSILRVWPALFVEYRIWDLRAKVQARS